MANTNQPTTGYAPGGNNNASASGKSNSSPFSADESPKLSLPKGGGSIRRIDEKFSVNSANGTSGGGIALPFSPSRNGFAPSLSLGYSSAGGNGLFGLGWSALPGSVTRKASKQLPLYRDSEESDTFIISGSDDLVPALLQDNLGNWITDEQIAGGQTTQRYRPRIERAFTKIEKITEANGNVYWKATTGDNTISIFGKSPSARIADPASPENIFEWLLEFNYDDKGNCYQYEYKQEDNKNIPNEIYEKNRLNGNAPFANTYLKRIKYCNKAHFHTNTIDLTNWEIFLTDQQYLMEMVFDYGEHDAISPTPIEISDWMYRSDAFSTYRSGFEIRTNRLCRRMLMFHLFTELGPQPCLVSSLDLVYTPGPAFSFLTSATQTGYICKPDGSYSQKSLPPVEYTYEQPSWDITLRTLSEESIANLPTGIDGSYQWLDLYSEGIPGVLTEQVGAWYYKANSGNGNLDGLQLVASKPTITGLNTGGISFQNIEADGRQFLVSRDLKGYYELTDDKDWLPFRTFDQVPNVDDRNSNVKLLDLNGDGRADILIDSEQVFTWFASLGTAGFDTYKTTVKSFDEEKGPVNIYDSRTQTIVLADMSGDGLTDIVRVRNGEIVYWPNLGYGRFGAKVTMNNAPTFDTPENFNPHYIKLADIDGSGLNSIIYLGHNTFKVYFNRSGNGWSEQGPEGSLNPVPFPKVDEHSTISVIDLLGNGTGCIVWSSALPQHQQAPLRYIDLMGGKKPYVMTSIRNNMGSETFIEYKPSTYYYLQDKLAGTPWVTKLPFPVQCVSQTISVDRIAKTRFTSQYVYHHGYYDHTEREFRGFGRVDQTDTENFDNYKKHADPAGKTQIVDEGFHQPPVLTRTWFHTGAFLNRKKILNQFAHEYYHNDAVPEKQLADPPLPANLTTDEWQEALRACKGIVLHSEIYTLDGSVKEHIPYNSNNTSCLIHQVQPAKQNHHSVWQVQQSESAVYTYERNLLDPRIAHTMTLQTDNYGNILKAAVISYGRKTVDADLSPGEQAEQGKVHIVISENRFTNAIITPDAYRLPVGYESSSWELTGTAPATGDYYSLTEIKNYFDTATVIGYESSPTTDITEKRLLSQSKTLFVKNDLSGPLPEGTIESLAITYQSYKLALTPGMMADAFGDKVTGDMLLKQGNYIHINDNNYWVLSGTSTLDAANFYQAVIFTDPLNFSAKVTYDSKYRLFVQKTEDAVGNTSSIIGYNFRTLSPWLIQDFNDNRAGLRMDELGMITATFTMGKVTELKGDLMDTDTTETSVKDKPIAIMEYNLFNYRSTGKPNYTKTTSFDTHFYDLNSGREPVTYINYAYSSGNGSVIMQKAQAAPGLALQENVDGTVTSVDTAPNLRWIGSGRTILNNKGNAVKQYEPYFSTSFEFEDSSELVARGISPLITYDSAGRALRTDFPDGTFTKVDFDAWKSLTYDQNDTVLESQWYADRIGTPVPDIATPEEVAAANKAKAHAGTPQVAYLNSLGQGFLAVVDNGPGGKFKTTTKMDISGESLSVTDARSIVVASFKYDMTGKTLYTYSPDAGERWNMTDVMGKTLLGFDSKGSTFRHTYDNIHRPLALFIKPVAGEEVNIEKTVYGEGQSNDKGNNVRGRAYRHFNESGMSTNDIYDFKGNLLKSSAQLCTDYKNMPDWGASTVLDSEVFISSSSFDALNHILTTTSPDNSIYMPAYDEAGEIKSVDVMLMGSATKTTFVKNISYDVKGRAESTTYGNNTKITSNFDPLTERLVQMITTGSNGVDILQKLSYTYDPKGNVTQIKDEAQQTIYFKNSVVSPSNEFTYDALYQLIGASGREHIGQNLPVAPNDPNRINLPLPGDGNAMRNYTQNYQYDGAGNILKMIHSAGTGSWTRTYNYEVATNKLSSETVGNNTQNYQYDAHGNMKNIAQLKGLVWNLKDELQMADLGGGGKAYYVYSGGQRAKKVIERLDGSREVRIYIGGFELYRKFDSSGKVQEETETLLVPGVARIETKTIKNATAAADRLFRYQYDNQLGSATLETDDKGAIISYEEYYPYGSTSYQAVNTTINAAAKRYRYTGLEHDDETGMQYHSARYYLPWLGRWLSTDRTGIEGGLNLYEYAASNPVSHSDTSGNAPSYPASQSGDYVSPPKEAEHDGVEVIYNGGKGTPTGPASGDRYSAAQKQVSKEIESDKLTPFENAIVNARLGAVVPWATAGAPFELWVYDVHAKIQRLAQGDDLASAHAIKVRHDGQTDYGWITNTGGASIVWSRDGQAIKAIDNGSKFSTEPSFWADLLNPVDLLSGVVAEKLVVKTATKVGSKVAKKIAQAAVEDVAKDVAKALTAKGTGFASAVGTKLAESAAGKQTNSGFVVRVLRWRARFQFKRVVWGPLAPGLDGIALRDGSKAIINDTIPLGAKSLKTSYHEADHLADLPKGAGLIARGRRAAWAWAYDNVQLLRAAYEFKAEAVATGSAKLAKEWLLGAKDIYKLNPDVIRKQAFIYAGVLAGMFGVGFIVSTWNIKFRR